jgi:error-prone DNA polymerase
LTLREHPISFLRKAMDEHGVTPARGLSHWPQGREVTVAGLVLMRQRPSTAKGITFVTLEDETGVVNLIIRQNIWELHRRAARSAVVMLATGELQREGTIIHVLVNRIEDWSRCLAALEARSRDFR